MPPRSVFLRIKERVNTHTERMNLEKGFCLFWTRALDYKGKTSRREFWWGVLANAIPMVVIIGLLAASLTYSSKPINTFSATMIVLLALFCLVELLPSVTLIIRRMHDIGKSGFYIFVLFIPVLGFIWYLYLVTRPSNFYGIL